MSLRRATSGALFIAAVYVFGVHLTAADGFTPLADHLFFGLFGSNDRAGIECVNGSKDLACSDGIRVKPNGAVEVVNLGTNPPTLLKAIDLGVSSPTAICVAPDTSQFYVVDSLNRNVHTILTDNGAFINTVYVPEGPVDAVLSKNGRYLYVTTREPSVVAIDTLWGIVVDQAIPGQPWPEWFGGIAISNAPGGDYLAVAATSGPAPMAFLMGDQPVAGLANGQAPIMYLLDADNGNLGLTDRVAISGYCWDSMCPSGDDAVFTGWPTALLNNLRCAEMFQVDRPMGEQIEDWKVTYDSYACPPLNPHNSTLFSRVLRRAYTVFRGPTNSEPPAMSIMEPETQQSWFISGFEGIPEAAAFAPDQINLFIVKQANWQAPLKLDLFEALTETYTPDIYTFGPMVQRRTAIDARVAIRPRGYVADSRSLLGPKTGSGLGGWLSQLALVGLGAALWLRDRKGPNKRA